MFSIPVSSAVAFSASACQSSGSSRQIGPDHVGAGVDSAGHVRHQYGDRFLRPLSVLVRHEPGAYEATTRAL